MATGSTRERERESVYFFPQYVRSTGNRLIREDIEEITEAPAFISPAANKKGD